MPKKKKETVGELGLEDAVKGLLNTDDDLQSMIDGNRVIVNVTQVPKDVLEELTKLVESLGGELVLTHGHPSNLLTPAEKEEL